MRTMGKKEKKLARRMRLFFTNILISIILYHFFGWIGLAIYIAADIIFCLDEITDGLEK